MDNPDNGNTTNLTNQFLIAMPQLRNSYFENTVIYMWQHNEEGALGIVVNLPTSMDLSEIFEQLEIEDIDPVVAHETVLSGGPVETDKGFIIHDEKRQYASTFDVTDDIHVTTSRDILEDISRGNGPGNYLVALGCSGWSPGQLEQEMADNTWLSCPAEEQIIFNTPVEERWQAAANLIGVDLQLMSNDAGHA